MSTEKKKQSHDVIHILEGYFAKAPVLPINIKEMLVKYVPYFALVFGIIGIIFSISSLGILGITSPLAIVGGAETVNSYGTSFVSSLFSIVSSAMMVMAYQSLQAKKLNGWNLMFWSEVVNIIGSIILLNIIGAVISGLIGFYLLYQIKSFYK